MKYCKNCGTQLEDDAVFCVNCGQKQVDGDNIKREGENNNAGNNNNYNNYNGNNGYNNYNGNNGNYNYGGADPSDAPSVGFGIISALWWIVGLILYFVFKDKYPLRAKSCLKGIIIGIIIEVVLGVIGGILMAAFGMSFFSFLERSMYIILL